MLEGVTACLGEALCAELVFVGGAVAGLLITDPAMPPIRPTEDVDVICKALVLTDYHRVEAALRAQGFVHDPDIDAPICRWRTGPGNAAAILDVMPTLEEILGFSNRWYPLAMDTAQNVTLRSGRTIRVIAAPVFVATKLEAFRGRGGGDYMSSHDLEDLLAIVDGRASLLHECQTSPPVLRQWLGAQFEALLAKRAFLDALPGHLPGDAASQARLSDLRRTLQHLAALHH